VVALECGWVATEVGRQPWTVWQVLRTTDAASTNPGLWWSYAGVLVIYLGMTVGAFVVLRSMARRWRAGEMDLPTPYGPGAAPVDEAGPAARSSSGER
jgi:cytochrome bd ubiquinol oxidase subunit I